MGFSQGKTDLWPIFLSCLLIFMALTRIPSLSIRAVSYVFTENGVYFALVVFIFFRINKWLALFLLLSLISAQIPALALNKDGSLNNQVTALMKNSAISARNTVIMGSLWYSLIVLLVRDNGVHWLMDAICVIALVNVAFVIVQYFAPIVNIGENDFRVITLWRWKIKLLASVGMSGLIGNPNTTSGLFAISFFCFLRNRWRVWRIPLLPVLAVPLLLGLMLTSSSNGMFSLVVAMIVMIPFYSFKYEREKYLASAYIIAAYTWIGMFALYFYYCVDLPGIGGRLDIWKLGLPLFYERWVYGFGIGHWKYFTGQLHAHNDIWQAIFDMGIVAGIIMTGYFVTTFIKLKKENLNLQGSVVVLALNSFIAFPMHVATTAIMGTTLLALLNVQTRKKNEITLAKRQKCNHLAWYDCQPIKMVDNYKRDNVRSKYHWINWFYNFWSLYRQRGYQ